MSDFDHELNGAAGLVLAQKRELAELFGYEARNEYEIRLMSFERKAN